MTQLYYCIYYEFESKTCQPNDKNTQLSGAILLIHPLTEGAVYIYNSAQLSSQYYFIVFVINVYNIYTSS